ncbi:hypothetical protein I2486_08515 [Cellulophaga sp. E16_2]|uniref:hypothetical protein n=1 Tax=Cellulophaga sp. E16_2 TaxID=2789297 RepID=UPI001A91E222|nr:hypothetical protein [Cellulophaga sp. E16_2]MBO0591452.1 hypothetical protein [Cellulophaga sp. E16_2]
MMNLKIQTLALKHYLVLVKILILTFSIISCKQEKKENLISSQNSVNETIYKGKKVVKEVVFKNNKQNFKSIFLLEDEGQLGSKGFTKELEVLIFNKDILVDSFSFKNKSILCDLKIMTDEIQVLGKDDNQTLFFPIIHSCDGEEPKSLIINIWDGKESNYEIDIPVYFENSESKTEFRESVAIINFKSNQIRQNVYTLINKETKIDLSEIESEKSNKVDKENPKCFTKSDISKIKTFLTIASEEKFSTSFEKKENINLEILIDFLNNKSCLGKNISFNKSNDCSDELKFEVSCSYDVTQEDIDDGAFSEETMYIYFNKINGRIYLNKLESGGR